MWSQVCIYQHLTAAHSSSNQNLEAKLSILKRLPFTSHCINFSDHACAVSLQGEIGQLIGVFLSLEREQRLS